jgi:hypothetical protein
VHRKERGVFTKSALRPIEERNYSIYYIVFAGFLFLGTMWAVVDEVVTRRPWKDVQRDYQARRGARLVVISRLHRRAFGV